MAVERDGLKKARILFGRDRGASLPCPCRRSPSRPPPPDRSAPPTGEPIVPDSEFEEALPPLDPELERPLEPIEAIDPAAPPFPPVPGPVEDVPLGDPALAEPLPPLTADIVPAEVAEPEGAAEEPVPVRYTLLVEGLEETGLEDRFRDLSALEDARGEAVNGAMVRLRAEEDETLMVRLLRSQGYYDAVAASSVELAPDQPGLLRVTLTASPGYIYNLGDIDITGPETLPPGIAREALALESGRPIIAEQVEAPRPMCCCACPSRAIPSPRSGFATSSSIPPRGWAPIPCRSIPARARPSAASPPKATSPSTRAMSACSPASTGASSTTGARSTTFARRWSPRACLKACRPSRC